MNESPVTAIMTRAVTEGPVYLDAKRLHFSRHGALLRLTIDDDRSCLKAQVFRAFPLTDPKRYYSIRDGEGKELRSSANRRSFPRRTAS